MNSAIIFAILLIITQTCFSDPLQQIGEGVSEYFLTKTRPNYLEDAIKNAYQTSNKIEQDKVHCSICRIVTAIILNLTKKGTSVDVIGYVIKDLCTLFTNSGYQTCVGYVDITINDLLYIIENKPDVTAERFCALRLQAHHCEYTDYTPWSVYLPPGYSSAIPKKISDKELNILHLTDLHYDPLYEAKSNAACGESLCCESTTGKPKSHEDEAGYWGDYRVCDMPWYSIEDLLQQVKKQHGQFDWVYFTGDIISHQVWNTSRENNQLHISQVIKKFHDTFGKTPVYPILGNHESHPTDFYPPESVTEDQFSSKWLFYYIANEWSRWLPASTLSTIRKGGYYTLLVRPGVRIIALNSNVCFVYNVWLVYDDTDPYGQLQWLSDTLLEAEQNQEAVHILSHVPPGDVECNKQWSREFKRIVERFHNTITGQFNGHTHYDELRVFFNSSNKEEVINVAYNGGSFTTFIGLNPNYRVYTIDAEQGRILDYQQWTYDLAEANNKVDNRPKWYKLYSFYKTYGFQPLNLPKFKELINNMSANPSLLENYRRLGARNSAAALKKCDQECLHKLLCSIRSVDYEDVVNCEREKIVNVKTEL